MVSGSADLIEGECLPAIGTGQLEDFASGALETVPIGPIEVGRDDSRQITLRVIVLTFG